MELGLANVVFPFYDDFAFTPNFDVRITNARVSGILNGTTQKALVGADIALNASVVPSGTTGGSYSWSFTGPYSVIGGSTSSSSVTIRSTDTGVVTANVTYTKNGFHCHRDGNHQCDLTDPEQLYSGPGSRQTCFVHVFGRRCDVIPELYVGMCAFALRDFLLDHCADSSGFLSY